MPQVKLKGAPATPIQSGNRVDLEAILSGIQPSAEQLAVLNAVESTTSHIMVEACAGAGKTTLATWATCFMRGSTVFVAFNKHNAEDMQVKLSAIGSSAHGRTWHSIGFSAIRTWRGSHPVRLEQYKSGDIFRALCQADRSLSKLGGSQSNLLRSTALKYVSWIKTYCLPWEEGCASQLDDLAVYHGMAVSPVLSAAAAKVAVMILRESAKDWSRIDYDDMVWLPVELDLPLPRWDHLIVDEAQDSSACQLALIAKSVANGSRLFVIGDRNQSVYGFRGADTGSMDRIAELLRADKRGLVTLPVNTTRRCSVTATKLANSVVPSIRPREGAPEGGAFFVSRDTWARHAKPGDLVLCRINAPLLGEAYKMLQSGQPARVLGRDIADGLLNLVSALFGEGETVDWDEFHKRLEAQVQSRLAPFQRMGERGEARILQLLDQRDCIVALAEGVAMKAPDRVGLFEFESALAFLFEEVEGAVTFGTCHRAKGLEADRVFILEPDLLPAKQRGSDGGEGASARMQQELNLYYVAVTRSKGDVVFVGGKSRAAAHVELKELRELKSAGERKVE